LVASVLAVSLTQASVAMAQPKPAPATADKAGATTGDPKKHYADGEKKYKAGDYAGALVEFEAADQAKPTSQAARYIALCQDNLGKYPEAVAAYERFLADVPKGMDTQADEARKRVTDIKAMPGKVHVETTPPGAAVSIDGQPHTLPTPTDVELPPGKHTLSFSLEGRNPAEKEVTVAFASTQTVSAELEAKPEPPPPPVAVAPPPEPAPAPAPPPPPEPRSKLPAFITGGLAVAAAGVGTVFGVMALSDKDDFDKNPTTSKADDGENHALIADMAFGVALTLGVTSAVLFLTGDDAPPASAALPGKPHTAQNTKKKSTFTVTPTPIVTPNGGGAGALIRF
jgi:hypothetical protein